MILATFLAGLFFTFIFWRKKRTIESSSMHKNFTYYLYKNSLEFLYPFVIVTFLYLITSWFIIRFASIDSTTINSLILIEDSIEKVKSVFSVFKLNALQVLFALSGVYLLGFFRFPVNKSKTLFVWLEKYQMYVRITYYFLVLLCSFTFFGTQLGTPSQKVQLQIKTIREGYADLANEAQDALSEEVARQLYEKALDTFPSSYRDALEAPSKIENKIDSLRNHYSGFQNRYTTKVPSTEKLIGERVTKTNQPQDMVVKVSEKPRNPKLLSENLNYKQIKEAKESVSRFRNGLRSKTIELLKMEGGKKVAFQIPRVFSAEVKKALFHQVTKSYPILEPIVDVFFKNADKHIEIKIDKAIDPMLKATCQNPENFEKIVVNNSSKIVREINIDISQSDLESANKKSSVVNLRKKMIDKKIVDQFRVLEYVEKKEQIWAERKLDKSRGWSENRYGNYTIECSCSCGSRLMWRRYVSSQAICESLCPDGMPCR